MLHIRPALPAAPGLPPARVKFFCVGRSATAITVAPAPRHIHGLCPAAAGQREHFLRCRASAASGRAGAAYPRWQRASRSCRPSQKAAGTQRRAGQVVHRVLVDSLPWAGPRAQPPSAACSPARWPQSRGLRPRVRFTEYTTPSSTTLLVTTPPSSAGATLSGWPSMLGGQGQQLLRIQQAAQQFGWRPAGPQ